MVKSARREYLEAIRRRYRKACKKDKKPILDEFAPIAVITANTHPTAEPVPGRGGKKLGAKLVYDYVALLTALKRIRLATDSDMLEEAQGRDRR